MRLRVCATPGRSRQVWFGVALQRPLFVAVYAVTFYVYACHIRQMVATQQMTAKRPVHGGRADAKQPAAPAPAWAELTFAAQPKWTLLDWAR